MGFSKVEVVVQVIKTGCIQNASGSSLARLIWRLMAL
jgi:hypothetical protein